MRVEADVLMSFTSAGLRVVGMPAPTNTPVKPWVVEMGKPILVARITVAKRLWLRLTEKAARQPNDPAPSPFRKMFLTMPEQESSNTSNRTVLLP